MSRTLVIGFGNIDRADDGIALHIINLLRRKAGQKTLEENEDGMEEMGGEMDSIFLVQLVPELIDLLVGYDQVIFIDAHVGPQMNDLHSEPVSLEFSPQTFTHHTTPAMLLVLLRTLNNQEIGGHTISIRGHVFDFHRNLSEAATALIEPAVEEILWICGHGQ